jgi:hypothetical protein
MARTAEQIQADLDEIRASRARGERSITTSQGRRVEFVDQSEYDRIISALESELADVTGSGRRRRKIHVATPMHKGWGQ